MDVKPLVAQDYLVPKKIMTTRIRSLVVFDLTEAVRDKVCDQRPCE